MPQLHPYTVAEANLMAELQGQHDMTYYKHNNRGPLLVMHSTSNGDEDEMIVDTPPPSPPHRLPPLAPLPEPCRRRKEREAENVDVNDIIRPLKKKRRHALALP